MVLTEWSGGGWTVLGFRRVEKRMPVQGASPVRSGGAGEECGWLSVLSLSSGIMGGRVYQWNNPPSSGHSAHILCPADPCKGQQAAAREEGIMAGRWEVLLCWLLDPKIELCPALPWPLSLLPPLLSCPVMCCPLLSFLFFFSLRLQGIEPRDGLHTELPT